MTFPQADTATELLGIDHVALRVPDPDQLTQFLCDHCDMQRGESEEGFSVLEPSDGGTRLLVSQADETPNPGMLQRLVLRVADLERALALLPRGLEVQQVETELAVFQGPQDIEFGFTWVPGGGVDYDLDHLVLRVMDPDETTIALAQLGFVPRGGALHVADKQLRIEPGIRSEGQNELLSHIAVRVESVDAVRGQVLRAGLEFDELTLAPNKLGVYVRGPERIRVEYTERT